MIFFGRPGTQTNSKIFMKIRPKKIKILIKTNKNILKIYLIKIENSPQTTLFRH